MCCYLAWIGGSETRRLRAVVTFFIFSETNTLHGISVYTIQMFKSVNLIHVYYHEQHK